MSPPAAESRLVRRSPPSIALTIDWKYAALFDSIPIEWSIGAAATERADSSVARATSAAAVRGRMVPCLMEVTPLKAIGGPAAANVIHITLLSRENTRCYGSHARKRMRGEATVDPRKSCGTTGAVCGGPTTDQDAGGVS